MSYFTDSGQWAILKILDVVLRHNKLQGIGDSLKKFSLVAEYSSSSVIITDIIDEI